MSEILVVSAMNILCFLIGAVVGQRVFERKPVIINPVKEIQDHIEETEHDKEEENFKTIADNIDNYNGTSIGQKRIGG